MCWPSCHIKSSRIQQEATPLQEKDGNTNIKLVYHTCTNVYIEEILITALIKNNNFFVAGTRKRNYIKKVCKTKSL